jgi:DmsE family decaheme c-type cytochrome
MAVEKKMKRLYQFLTLCAFMLACGVGASVATAAEPGASVKAALEKDAVCTACHDESWRVPVLAYYQTKHGNKTDSRTPGCTSCHGASEGHLKEGPGTKPDVVFAKGKSSPEAQNAVCETCHKTGNRINWSGSPHESRDVTCTNCHQVHIANQKVLSKATQAEVCFNCHKTQRAQTHRISSHPLTNSVLGSAAKMACSDCHNPHGSTGPSQLVKNSVNETCFTCHAEKRGPFLFEHSPVVDDCTNCHTVHGSNTAPLLKARLPFLCQQCHQDHGGPIKSGTSVASGIVAPGTITTGTALGSSPTVQGNGRMCLNCHVMIHGSNAPSGAFFNR